MIEYFFKETLPLHYGINPDNVCLPYVHRNAPFTEVDDKACDEASSRKYPQDVFNKSKGKLLSHLLDEQGLVRDGYFLRTMAIELRNALNDYTVEHITKANCIYTIKEYVESGYPVILQVDNEDFSHAILAIGTEYEGDEDDEKLLKLFCLDPGYGKSKSSYWNCVIDTSRKNTSCYPYWYITDENTCKVEIKEIITLEEI